MAKSATSHDLIAYGILRSRGTLENIIRHRWTGQYIDVLVDGWAKSHRAGGSIWYARPTPGEILEAVLIRGLTDADLEFIDQVEGTSWRHYVRVRAEYLDADGHVGEAWIYQDGDSWTPPEMPKRNRRRTSESLEDIANRIGVTTSTKSFRQISTTRSTDDRAVPVKDDGTSGGSRTRRRLSSPPADRRPPEPHRDLPLFAYGALTFREVLEERIGHQWSGQYEPAALMGWVIESGWPRHAVEAPDGVAHGFRLPGLTQSDLEKIDRYEGTHRGVYRREVVTLMDGTEAYFYATGPAGHSRLERRNNGQEKRFRPFISGQKVGV